METAPLTSDTRKAFAVLLWDVSRHLRTRLDARASEIGLTSAQWRVLSTLARCEKHREHPLNQASLADLLEIEPITLSRQIDRLAAAGLIERRPDPGDRRAYRLHLTEAARPVVSGFRDLASDVLDTALAGVGEDEIAALTDALGRIRANLTGKPAATDAGDAAPAPAARTRKAS